MLPFSWQSNLGFAAMVFFWSAWEVCPGEAPSPGQAALPQVEHEHCSAPVGQDLPPVVACRSQESSMAVGDRENSSGSFLRVACG